MSYDKITIKPVGYRYVIGGEYKILFEVRIPGHPMFTHRIYGLEPAFAYASIVVSSLSQQLKTESRAKVNNLNGCGGGI